MIWFIIVGLLILAIPVTYRINKKIDKHDMTLTGFVVLITIIITFLVTICFFMNRGATKDEYLELYETYQGLNYKAEKLDQGISDELGLNNNDIINEITIYNQAVRTLQRQNKSPWLNWYVVDEVDNLKLIDYTKFSFNEEQ